jgi:hypothetical protein
MRWPAVKAGRILAGRNKQTKFPSSVRRGGAKRRGGSKAAILQADGFGTTPPRDPLRDPAALTQEGIMLNPFLLQDLDLPF